MKMEENMKIVLRQIKDKYYPNQKTYFDDVLEQLEKDESEKDESECE